MKIERTLRGIAGFFILVSLALAIGININWLWLTALIGFNLLQSAFTDWCPMMLVLKRKKTPDAENGVRRSGE